MATKKPEKPKKKKPLPPRPRPYGKTWSFGKGGIGGKETGPAGKSEYIVAGGPTKYIQKKKYIEDEGGTQVTTERSISVHSSGKARVEKGKKLKKPSLKMGIKSVKKKTPQKSKPKAPPKKKKTKEAKPAYVKIAEKTMTGPRSDMPLVMPKKGAKSKDEGMIHDPMKMTKKRRKMLESQKWA